MLKHTHKLTLTGEIKYHENVEVHMDKKTLTRNDITDALFKEIGLSKQECSQLLESVLLKISDSLIENKVVKLSSFGTFSPKEKRARVGRNPKTGVEATINARRVISFRPSSLMKAKINTFK